MIFLKQFESYRQENERSVRYLLLFYTVTLTPSHTYIDIHTRAEEDLIKPEPIYLPDSQAAPASSSLSPPFLSKQLRRILESLCVVLFPLFSQGLGKAAPTLTHNPLLQSIHIHCTIYYTHVKRKRLTLRLSWDFAHFSFATPYIFLFTPF